MTAKATYERLKKDREPFLQRARENAEYTIPTLFPPEGHNGHDDLRKPNQSFAADAVNTLSSKMVLGMFPAGVPIFKQEVPKGIQMELTQGNPEGFKEITRVLGMIETEATRGMEQAGWRPVLHATKRNLIAGGNYLIQMQDDGSLRGFNLNHYVVRRDPRGTILEIVAVEEVSPETLPDGVREAVKAKLGEAGPEDMSHKMVKVYTHVFLSNGRYEIYQECEGELVDDSIGHYPKDKLPWFPVRWMAIEGEHYGRSMVEDYLPDMIALDVISKGIKEAVALGVRTVFLVRPGAVTKVKDLIQAENGDCITGREDDITTLRLDKGVDLSTAERWAEKLEVRLGKAFLLHTAVQRKGERVTLGEIRFMITELNDALGGIYSILAAELQKPLIAVHLDKMTNAGKLPRLPNNATETTLVTGLDALSREHDLQNLMQAGEILKNLFGPEAAIKYMNPDDIIRRVFTNLRIDPDGAVKTSEQQAREQQEEQVMELVAQLGPNAMQILQQMVAGQQQQGAAA